MSDRHFYIQPRPRGPWHVESDEDCERMLCGLYISVDGWTNNISEQWGVRKCPDCWILLEMQHKIEALAPHRVER